MAGKLTVPFYGPGLSQHQIGRQLYTERLVSFRQTKQNIVFGF